MFDECGGKEEKEERKDRGGDRFLDVKGEITGRLHRLKELQEEISASVGAKAAPRETIKLKQEVRKLVQELKSDIQTLKKEYRKEVDKKGKSKLSAQELEHRKAFIDEFESQLGLVTGDTAKDGEFPMSAGVTSLEDFRAAPGAGGAAAAGGGTVSAASGGRTVEMTAAQRMAMAQIDKNEEQIDGMLVQLEGGLTRLQALAEGLGEEFKIHNAMLIEVENKVDKVTDKMANVNKQMKETLDKVTGGGDKFCMHMICCIILLGVLTVIYNMVKSHK